MRRFALIVGMLMLSSVAEAAPSFRPHDELELADIDRDGKPDLVAILKHPTVSGYTELAVYSGASNFQTLILEKSLAALNAKDESWTFRLGDWNKDNKIDLIGIARNKTGSKLVEVNILSGFGAAPYQTFLLQIATKLPQIGMHWDVDVADWNSDGTLDLIGVQKAHAGNPGDGKMELTVLSGATNFQTALADKVKTPIASRPQYAYWTWRAADWNADDKPDLAMIIKNKTASGKVEVSALAWPGTAAVYYVQQATPFAVKGPDVVFRVADFNNDGAPDLAGLTKFGAGSGKIEANILSGRTGASYLQTWLLQIATGLGLHRPSPQMIALCPSLLPSVQADRNGVASASDALQACLDALPKQGVLDIPAGTYLITKSLHLSNARMLRTLGTAGSTIGCLQPGAPACAVLLAASNALFPIGDGFVQLHGMPGQVGAASNTLDHIVIDGNRWARLETESAEICAQGNNRAGFNASVREGGNTFRSSASIRSLCGTGIEWVGPGSDVVTNSLIAENGDHYTPGLWSDGLSVFYGSQMLVTGNTFRDNSDVDLIFGAGWKARVTHNRIEHARAPAFAGMMLGNYADAAPYLGDYTGAEVSGNVIDCGALLCDFGMNIGQHAWDLKTSSGGAVPHIIGGTLYNNTVTGAKLGVNIDGAGTAEAPVVYYNNTVSGSPTSATFLCGVKPTSNVNIGPDAVARNAIGQPVVPNTAYPWHECP